MRILGPVVQAFMGACSTAGMTLGVAIESQFVGNDALGRLARFFSKRTSNRAAALVLRRT